MLKHLRWLVPVCLLLTPMAQGREAIRLANSPALSPDGATLAFEWNGDVWTVPVNGGEAHPLTQHPGRDGEPRFSPDGKEIAFISDRDGTRQVYVVPTAGGSPKQLTFHSAGHGLQEWAPDGKSLLVQASRDHGWRHADRFFTVARSERPAEQLLFDDYGASGTLSPDGKRLLFTREGEPWWRKGYKGSQASQVWMCDVDKKSFTKILAGEQGCRWPMWRPDGKGFYYVSAESGYSNLWEYDLELKTKKELTRLSGDNIVFSCISRDGTVIVFRQLFDLYRLNPGAKEPPRKIDIWHNGDRLTNRKERRTLQSANQVAFSSDSLEIAFTAGGDLWVMDTELREPRQVTTTPEEERDPVFAPDGESILFVSDAGGKTDVWKAERTDKQKFWWQNTKFKLQRVTNDGDVSGGLRFTPDGTRIAYRRSRGDVWTADLDGKNAKRLVQSWSTPDFDFSPDNKWLVYSVDDNDFNRDVWLAPLDGSAKPLNLSRHPNNESQPAWSPDGRVIAYAGQRASIGADAAISIVFLRTEDAEKDAHDRAVEKAIDKINKVRKPGSRRPFRPDSGSSDGGKKATPVVIDREGLHDRIRRVRLGENGSVSALFWSPDGKKLAFIGRVDGRLGTYTLDVYEDLTPKQLASATGAQPRWLKQGNQIVWLSGGVPASLPAIASPSASTGGLTGRFPTSPRGRGTTPPTTEAATAGTSYRFSAVQEVDLPKKYAAAFDLCWRTMRDSWYDERLGNKDWDAVRRKYIDAAAQSPDVDSFATVVQLMLGELNGSHLGFIPFGGRGGLPLLRRRGSPTDPPSVEGAAAPVTAHLGVRFDPEFAGPGLKVRDVLPNGPADQKKSRLVAGDVIVSIDGTKVGPGEDLTRVLNGPLARDLALKVRDAAGKERDVTLRPTSYNAARILLYEKWQRDNRKAVEAASKGTLGYLHISAMSMPSFHKFEEELYSVGSGKDGLVIDVRENGGGSTTDHLLTALTQPVHAITVPRGGGPGYPQDRKVYATWNKPLVVLCNQNSFSNAEIFSHAIKTLKRGKLVGTPTAGGVISTGATSIMDLGLLRVPMRGWFVVESGEDMELNGAVPHYIVWPEPGDMPRGKDAQLAKAVEVLLADVSEWKKRPRPRLKKASERQPATTTSSR